MGKHEVLIVVDENAEMTITVTGLKGRACQEATASLEALGFVSDDKPTEEMNELEVGVNARVQSGYLR